MVHQEQFLLSVILLLFLAGCLAQTTTTPVPAPAKQAEYSGRVVKVVDGDTLDVGERRVRLALVNTPEKEQPGYAEAKEFTAALCPVGSTAILDIDDGQPVDRFGRTVAVVYCQGRNLNAELLHNGHARILEQYVGVSEFDPGSW